MAQCRPSCWWKGLAGLALGISLLGGPAEATLRHGPLEISGSLETQNIIRHSSLSKIGFVQNRNTFQLRVDWDWLRKGGKLVGMFDLPFIKRSSFFLLYRGVYDGFYDLAPGGDQVGQTRFDDLIGGPIEGNPFGSCRDPLTGDLVSCSRDAVAAGRALLRSGHYSRLSSRNRTAIKYENRLREVYVDFTLRDAPLSFRIGRQQVIWGESDQFRVMDIWNPLDVTWHFQLENWDRIRKPLWLVKGLWDIGRVGPISNSFLEVVYNPFDFQNGNKIDWMPRPWGIPVPNPVRAGQIQAARRGLPSFLRLPLVTPVFDLQGTNFRIGDFHRNPEDASEVGARFHGVTPQGVEFAMAYMYGRARLFGAAKPLGLDIESITLPGMDPTGLSGIKPLGKFSGIDVVPADLKAKFRYPYTHIFGFTGNFFEGDFTKAVLRWETAFSMGQPFQTIEESKRVLARNGLGNFVCIPKLGSTGDPVCRDGQISVRSPLGFTKREVWTGMVGFDRPTWIRWLNSKATWFLTGQFFWNYTLGNTSALRESTFNAQEGPYYKPSGQAQTPYTELLDTAGVGTWESGPYAGQVERIQDASFNGNDDNVRRWELLTTIAGTSFYRGGTLVPFVALVFDPVNRSMFGLWTLDYFYSNDFIIRLEQRYFSTLGQQRPSNDPWFVGGRFKRRDESVIRLTYQF